MGSVQEFSCIIRKFCSFSAVENPAKGSRVCPKAGFSQITGLTREQITTQVLESRQRKE
jgi:hypothetical protein